MDRAVDVAECTVIQPWTAGDSSFVAWGALKAVAARMALVACNMVHCLHVVAVDDARTASLIQGPHDQHKEVAAAHLAQHNSDGVAAVVVALVEG